MLQLYLTSLAALFVARYVFRWLAKISLSDLRGPPSKSWLAGNIIDLFEDTTGTLGARWLREYGTVMKLHPQIGTSDAILVSDPAALRYIFQSDRAEKFVRAPEWYAVGDFLVGQSVGTVEGEEHKRHRKGIQPAFGAPETRALFPVLQSSAQKLCEKWDSILVAESGNHTVLNISDWFSKTALDTLGEVAFDHQFGGLDGSPTELAAAMPSVLVETFGSMTVAQAAFVSLLQYLPMSLIRWILDKAPSDDLEHVRKTNLVSNKILLQFIDEKRSMGAEGKNDMMSNILRAGLSEDPSSRLTDQEIVSQLRFLLIAGHETTANTLSWALLELCKLPSFQTELRREIRQARERKSGNELSHQDLQALPLLNAVLKETLRFAPVLPNIFRENVEDEVLPLAQPVTLKSGRVIDKLPIPKGTRIYISVGGYNMNPALWGDDADTFNPHRWLGLGGEQSKTLGLYANLMTFSAGTKGCIGWKFALMQLQTLLSALIDRFEFSLPEKAPQIIHANCMTMQPMIEGQTEHCAQLPMAVRRAL